jgi:hypothetical protein
MATTGESFKARGVAKNFLSEAQSEGMGATVRRSIGRRELDSFDPFLLLDEFNAGLPGGFPDHPHRGFETVTYLLPESKGTIKHEDFMGHKGEIQPGGLQWMTAGRGILHSEMPGSTLPAHGLQLWINLPKSLKMTEPRYQELHKEALPRVGPKDGVTAIVISGEALGTTSPIYTHTPTNYAHFIMEPNSKLEQPIPKGFNAFIYSWKGSALVAGAVKVEAHHVITLDSNGDGLQVETKEEPFEFVLVSGKPIKEHLARRGPFVMNTQAELLQTMEDYRDCKNGFENARNWVSEIGRG